MDAPPDGAADLSFDQLMELDRRASERAGGGGRAGDDHGEDGDPHGDDESIVLPWWQHPVNIVTMVVTAAVIAALVGWMVGDSSSRIQHTEVDTGFLQDMRIHHEQAVYMGFVYLDLPDAHPGLRIVAAEIVRGQSAEVGRMVQLLRDYGEAEAADLSQAAMTWMGMSAAPGQMPGMASEEQLDELEQASGAEADRVFVELMTAHHLGGIEMAEYAAERAGTAEVRTMAAKMAEAQRGEIAEMEGLLE